MKLFWALSVFAVIQGMLDVQAESLRQEDIDYVFNQQPGQVQNDQDYGDKSIEEDIDILPRRREAKTLNSIAEETLEDNAPERPSYENRRDDGDAVAIIQVSGKSVLGDDDYSEPDEDMDTAETIVFRPLFRYKKQSIAKKRVFKDRTGHVYAKPTYVSDAPLAHKKSPPAILVYDRATGGYYPVKG